jgi:hypothetical protein
MEEYRDEFLDHIRYMIFNWSDLPDKTNVERLEGLAFTILSAIDGSTPSLPTYVLAPVVDADGNHGDNISGSLHELLFRQK